MIDAKMFINATNAYKYSYIANAIINSVLPEPLLQRIFVDIQQRILTGFFDVETAIALTLHPNDNKNITEEVDTKAHLSLLKEELTKLFSELGYVITTNNEEVCNDGMMLTVCISWQHAKYFDDGR